MRIRFSLLRFSSAGRRDIIMNADGGRSSQVMALSLVARWSVAGEPDEYLGDFAHRIGVESLGGDL
jgi:hypothetical protein